MSRRAAAAIVALAALVAVFGSLWLVRQRRAPAPAQAWIAGPPAGVEPASPLERRQVTLWLPTSGGRLAPLAAEVESGPELAARLEALVAALLAAPSAGELVAVFPQPVRVVAQVIGPDGTLFVDLRAEDGGPPPGAGSTLETQRIYAIVHTVLRNEPRIERVVLLWNGVQRESLAGHVDTGRPLLLRPELEAR
jgi:hypothetical protein